MNEILMNLLTVALLLTFVWKIELVTPLSEINEDYLSPKSCKMIKGLLAVMIVFHHLAQKTNDGFTFQQFVRVGCFVVAMFFFFSGYGLQKKYMIEQTYHKQFLIRRLPTVLFPYIIMTFIYWGFHALFGTFYSLKDILLAIYQGTPIVWFSWYVINILLFYIGFYFLMILFKKNYNGMVFGAILYYICWILLCKQLAFHSYWYNASFLLVVGMIWAIYEKTFLKILQKRFMKIIIISWISFLLLFLVSDTLQKLLPIPDLELILSIVKTCLFVICVITFTLKFKIGNPILDFLGNISFEIYLTQGIFITLFRCKFIYIHNEFLWCCFVLAGTITFSIILHKIFDILLTKYKRMLSLR